MWELITTKAMIVVVVVVVVADFGIESEESVPVNEVVVVVVVGIVSGAVIVGE